MRVAQAPGNGLGLAAVSRSVGTGIDLDQTDDVRIDGADEVDDMIQIVAGVFKKAGIGHGQMIHAFVACRIADVVEKKTHDNTQCIRKQGGAGGRIPVPHDSTFIKTITDFSAGMGR